MIKFNRKFFQKSGKIRKSKKNPKNPKKYPSKKSKKSIIFFDRFFTPAGVPFPLEQSLILLGRIHTLGHLSNNKELVHFHLQLTLRY